MEKQPAGVLALIVACAMFGVGCIDSEITDDVADDGLEAAVDEPGDETSTGQEASACAAPAGVYNPYAHGSSGSGTVAQYPWRGASSTYPSGNEDFRGYATATTVECSSAKSARSHLDVPDRDERVRKPRRQDLDEQLSRDRTRQDRDR